MFSVIFNWLSWPDPQAKARPDLKVIVCSGYSIAGPAQDILDAGAEGFIQKPFLIVPSAEKLKEVLEGK